MAYCCSCVHCIRHIRVSSERSSNHYLNNERSLAKMVNKVAERFGPPESTIICLGDYNQGSYHLPGKEPTIGKGLRNVFRDRGYQVFMVWEAWTSKNCHNCFGENAKCLYRNSKKPSPATLGPVWSMDFSGK